MSYKLSSKKKKQINKSKQKANIKKTSSRKLIISNLKSFEKNVLSVPIPVIKTSKSKAKNINIAMIDANSYHLPCRFKKTSVFAILMRDI